MKYKHLITKWGYQIDGYRKSNNPYEEAHVPYIRDIEGRMDSVKISWKQFKEDRPFCAELLEVLFENEAKEVHLFVGEFSETRAMLALEPLKRKYKKKPKVNPV